ncbi:MAG: response regulator, partial [Treponema sp.]
IQPEENDSQEDSKKPKVVIVDDDAVISKLLSSAFESAGFICKQYSTGTEFLSQFSKSKCDIVILDIFMPGISGFDTLKRLQNLPSPPPVIVYSQAVDREMIIQILSFGAKQYIVKPQKPEVIVQKALEIINAVKQ